MKCFVKLAILATIATQYSSTFVCQAFPRSPFGQVRDLFDEFDRAFVQSVDIYDNQRQGVGIVVQDDSRNLKKMRESSQRINQLVTNLLNNGSYASAQDAAKTFHQVRSDVAKEIESLRDAVAKLDATVIKTKEFAQFSIKDYEKDNGKKYVIEVALPGFSEKDVVVNVMHNQESEYARNASSSMLEIVAKKQKNVTNSKHDTDAQEVALKTAESMHSMKIINGKKHEMIYENGSIKVMCDLPQVADEDNYVMTFKGDTLTIEFEKKSAESRKRSLEFSKK